MEKKTLVNKMIMKKVTFLNKDLVASVGGGRERQDRYEIKYCWGQKNELLNDWIRLINSAYNDASYNLDSAVRYFEKHPFLKSMETAVFYRNGIAVGTISYGFIYNTDIGGCSRIAVCPEFQREGVGSDLLQYAEERLFDRGCRRIEETITLHRYASLTMHFKAGYRAEKLFSKRAHVPNRFIYFLKFFVGYELILKFVTSFILKRIEAMLRAKKQSEEKFMDELRGKKLLILAGSVHECDLVRRAKELGVYTIVTDYYDLETSPAKKMADEYWDISWNDIDALEKKCREEKVNGVTAGYSESTVESLIKLCERLNLPCYCSQEQLRTMRDKVLFKETCRRNGVPVVREYASIDEVVNFPVIVKPVDRGGSIGVGVASNRGELIVAVEYAKEKSYCKKVIIEDYIYNGTKFDAYYVITNGKIKYLSSSDTINAAGNGFDKVVQSGWILPSCHEEEYLKKADPQVKNMISNLGIQNGFLFLSGFAVENDFVFFETGFRLSGGHMYRYFEANGMGDIQDVFIRHALTGNGYYGKQICQNNLKALIINFYAKEGVLTKMQGWEEIANMPSCGFALPMCRIGTECHQDKAILTKLGMIHVYDKKKEVILDSLDKVNNIFVAEDQNGNDMVFDRMDRNIVEKMM